MVQNIPAFAEVQTMCQPKTCHCHHQSAHPGFPSVQKLWRGGGKGGMGSECGGANLELATSLEIKTQFRN